MPANNVIINARDPSAHTRAVEVDANGRLYSSIVIPAGTVIGLVPGTEVDLTAGSEVIVLAQSDDGTYDAIEVDDDGQLKVVAADIGVEGTDGYLVGYWQAHDLQEQILCELQKIAAQLAILTGEERPIGDC